MKRTFRLLLILITTGAAGLVWLLLGPATDFQDTKKYFVIEEGKTSKEEVTALLEKKYIIKHPWLFSVTATTLGIWNNIKPGKYEVKHGESLLAVIKKLKNNRQASSNLVINKIRLKEDLAKLIAKNFQSDSASVMTFLNSNDSLQAYKVDTSTALTFIIQDTYTFYWNTSLRKIFNRLYDASLNYWSQNNRMDKAAQIHFTPTEVYILASIVEEETNKDDDRAKIASVYINRLNKQMPLQACPTIKYAMKDFSLTRIYEKYLFNPSAYNTYRRKGLPPGPICTPSPKCIDIVLNAPKTDYLFFVAKSDFSGYHHFSNNYAEHNRYAKEYQKALNEYMLRKQEKEANENK
ncbi:MAG: endolytic transglycosylase MltG [Sphingobacteriia bacterium]|nr:endolytic transglycosylase MltG [Sphingobacteriia bacterium]